MFGIGSLFKRNKSKNNARNRLEVVLVQDRSGLTSSQMKNLKQELFNVMQKYFVMDKKSLDIEWQRDGDTTALVVNTALRGKNVVKAAA